MIHVADINIQNRVSGLEGTPFKLKCPPRSPSIKKLLPPSLASLSSHPLPLPSRRTNLSESEGSGSGRGRGEIIVVIIKDPEKWW